MSDANIHYFFEKQTKKSHCPQKNQKKVMSNYSEIAQTNRKPVSILSVLFNQNDMITARNDLG